MQVIKVVGATRTWFIYAGAQLISEYTDAASATYSSPTAPGSAPSDSLSTVLYQHSDHLTTRVTTENDGDLSNQQAHYPYGENWYNVGTADPSVKRKFTSYRKETEGALASGQINYAIARYHGARTGRFHRPDPVRGRIKNPQRLNRYAYVTGNPINRIDPRGLDERDGETGPCLGGECIMQDWPNWGTPEDALFANPTWQNFNVSVGLAPNAFGPEWIVGPRPGSVGGPAVGIAMFNDTPGSPRPPVDCNAVEQNCLRDNSYLNCIRTNAFLGGLGGGALGSFAGGFVGTVSGAISGAVFGALTGVVTCPFNVEQHCAEKRRQCMRENYQVTPLVPPPPG